MINHMVKITRFFERLMPPIGFTSEQRDHGSTLAAVLRRHFRLSWSRAKQTIERRHVRVAGQIVADAAYRVRRGQRITIAAGAIEIPGPRTTDVPKPLQNSQALPHTLQTSSKNQSTNRVKKKSPSSPLSSSSPLPPSSPSSPSSPAELPLPRIIYSDDHVVVVDKPAGLTTSRSREDAAEFGRGARFLPSTLHEQLPRLLGQRQAPVFPVHRLDRDTSGLVVFARTRSAASRLARQFKSHTVERVYLALVRGEPRGGRIESTLVEDRGDGRRGSGPNGVPAVTHVTVRERFLKQKHFPGRKHTIGQGQTPGQENTAEREQTQRTEHFPEAEHTEGQEQITGRKHTLRQEHTAGREHTPGQEGRAGFALVECRLETGRTHQVRIHLGESGTPLCGERVYDRPRHGAPLPDASAAARPMLHAAVLGFAHPATGEILHFQAEPPADFQALLERFRAGG